MKELVGKIYEKDSMRTKDVATPICYRREWGGCDRAKTIKEEGFQQMGFVEVLELGCFVEFVGWEIMKMMQWSTTDKLQNQSMS